MEEIFVPIKGFENYLISNHGNVISLPKEHRTWQKGLKKYFNNKSGYYRVDLCKDKRVYHKTIHRLVAEHFVPNPDNKPQVNHEDGNKLNNHASNLTWATRSENQQHAVRTGLRKVRGEDNCNSFLTSEKVKQIRESKLKGAELSKIYNTSPQNISDIRSRKSWKHL